VKRFFSKELAAVCISAVFCTRRRTVVVVVVVDDFMNSSDYFPASMAQRIALILLPLMTTPPPPPQKEPTREGSGEREKNFFTPFSARCTTQFLGCEDLLSRISCTFKPPMNSKHQLQENLMHLLPRSMLSYRIGRIVENSLRSVRHVVT
jgi:hypothetical protein